MAISIKSLSKIQFRQLHRDKSKGQLFGDLLGIVYFWIIEFVVFFILKDEGIEVPALVAVIVALSLIVPDFILKLVVERDNTVMDAFLKTRPISQEKWDRFLSVSQFWKVSNLLMPLAIAPACFLFIPFPVGLPLLVVLYLFSVFGGFLVMLLKHRGPYQSEKMVKTYFAGAVRSAKGNFISGIQFRSFFRSKRLKSPITWLSIIFYLQCITQSLNENSTYGALYVFLFIFLFSSAIPKYGFAIEANFFNGIWSRPINIEKMLTSKYRFGILCGSAAALLSLPLSIWSNISVYDIVAFTIFNCCFTSLLIMFDSYNCGAFELFGKSFFNNQGSRSTVRGSIIIGLLGSIGIGYAVIILLPGWKSQAILSALGIIGLCISRPFFRHVAGRFIKNRYEYMSKYTSK